MMTSLPTVSTLASLLFALALAGCQKNEEAAQQAPANEPVQSSSQSVAMPEGQLPPSDAAITPETPAAQGMANSGNASGPSQANPKELTQQQESTAMPLPGQVNNHSTVPTIGGEQK